MRSSIYKEIGAYEYAERDCSRALTLKKRQQSWFYTQRGVCYQALGKSYRSIRDLDRIIALLGDLKARRASEIYACRAWGRAGTGDAKGAEEDLNQYLSEDHSDFEKNFFKAIVYSYIDSDTTRIEKAFNGILSNIGGFIKSLHYLLPSRHSADNLCRIIEALPDFFYAPPELKRLRKRLAFEKFVAVLLNNPQAGKQHIFRLFQTRSDFAALMRGEVKYRSEAATKDIERKYQKMNVFLRKKYPNVTTKFFMYFFFYVSEQVKIKRIRTMKELPSAELYYERAVSHYLNNELEQARCDLESALELNPDFMKAHYGLSTVLALLAGIEKNSRKAEYFRKQALYSLRQAVEDGWSHLDYTLKDREFKALGLGKLVPLTTLRSWEKTRDENQKRVKKLKKRVIDLSARKKAIRALQLLYYHRIKYYRELDDLIAPTEKAVLESLRKKFSRKAKTEEEIERKTEEEIKRLFGERGEAMLVELGSRN